MIPIIARRQFFGTELLAQKIADRRAHVTGVVYQVQALPGTTQFELVPFNPDTADFNALRRARAAFVQHMLQDVRELPQ